MDNVNNGKIFTGKSNMKMRKDLTIALSILFLVTLFSPAGSLAKTASAGINKHNNKVLSARHKTSMKAALRKPVVKLKQPLSSSYAGRTASGTTN